MKRMQIMRAVLALGASSTAESSFVRSSRAEGRSCMKEAYARRDARRTARTSTVLAARRSPLGSSSAAGARSGARRAALIVVHCESPGCVTASSASAG
jgi:hypothetical protein